MKVSILGNPLFCIVLSAVSLVAAALCSDELWLYMIVIIVAIAFMLLAAANIDFEEVIRRIERMDD